MAARPLFIIAYDISDDNRLNRLRKLLKGYSTGNQKSVYECFLTEGELKEIIEEITLIIDESCDRVHIFQFDFRRRIHSLGIGVPPKDPAYFYIG